MGGLSGFARQSQTPGPSVVWVSDPSLSQAYSVTFNAPHVGVLVLARRCLSDDAGGGLSDQAVPGEPNRMASTLGSP